MLKLTHPGPLTSARAAKALFSSLSTPSSCRAAARAEKAPWVVERSAASCCAAALAAAAGEAAAAAAAAPSEVAAAAPEAPEVEVEAAASLLVCEGVGGRG